MAYFLQSALSYNVCYDGFFRHSRQAGNMINKYEKYTIQETDNIKGTS